MEIFNNNDEIEVPSDVEINVDTDATEGVNPEFAEIEPQVETPEQEPESPEAGQEDPKPEPEAPQPQPEAEAPEAEPSSLTDQPTNEPVIEMDDEGVMKYLSEKLGKDITSLEDLNKPATDPLENDPELKAIAEWRERTGRPISDWSKYQRDFNELSNEDVAREYLQHKFPDLTPEEIQLEMEDYLPSEDDLDREVAKKALNLKKLASEGRNQLNSLRMELDTPIPAKLSPEQAQAVEAYTEIQKQQEMQTQIAAKNDQNLSTAIESFDTIPLTLDKDVSIDFKPSQEAKKTLREYMNMPSWYNPDGTLNAQEVVRDSLFLQNRETIIQEAYKQGLSNGLAQIEKTTNNITLDGRQTSEGATPSTSDIEVEGLDDMLGKQLKFR